MQLSSDGLRLIIGNIKILLSGGCSPLLCSCMKLLQLGRLSSVPNRSEECQRISIPRLEENVVGKYHCINGLKASLECWTLRTM